MKNVFSKTLVVFFALIIMLFVTACGEANDKTGPELTLDKMEKAVNDCDMDALLECYDPTARSMYEGVFALIDNVSGLDISDFMNALFDSGIGKGVTSLDIELLSITYDDADENTATVSALFKSTAPTGESSTTENFIMKKTGDEWLIAFELPSSSSTEDTSPEVTDVPIVAEISDSCYQYEEIDGGISITGFEVPNGYSPANASVIVNIPEKLDGKQVKSVSVYAFNDEKILYNMQAVLPDGAEYFSPESDFTFLEKSDYAILTGFTGSSHIVVIPEQYKGLPVTRIGASALASSEILEVFIPSTVTTLDEKALIGPTKARGLVHIPASVTEIGDDALFYYYGMNKYCCIVEAERGSYIQDYYYSSSMYFFRYCYTDRVGSMYFSVFPEYASLIRYDGADENVVIPDNIDGIPVTEIYTRAFENATISNVTIPSGVQTICLGAFNSCGNLTSLVIPGTVKTIGERAFDNNAALKTVVIEAGVEEIMKDAFRNCKSLLEMKIPQSVVKIDSMKISAPYLTIEAAVGSAGESFANRLEVEFKEAK